MISKLLIITTGGTIDKIYFDDKSDYQVGEPQISQILHAMHVAFDFQVSALMRKDSLHITDRDRALIRAAVEASNCRHILITHGTDSMVETARALKGLGERRIVITGAPTAVHSVREGGRAVSKRMTRRCHRSRP